MIAESTAERRYEDGKGLCKSSVNLGRDPLGGGEEIFEAAVLGKEREVLSVNVS